MPIRGLPQAMIWVGSNRLSSHGWCRFGKVVRLGGTIYTWVVDHRGYVTLSPQVGYKLGLVLFDIAPLKRVV